MENFYKDMTYMAVYDGHGTFGRVASDLANGSIKEYLEENKENLFKIDGEEEITKFFKTMYKKVQDKFHDDVCFCF
jgi:serine/threonine protein phosphatase PrpC